MTRIDPDPRFPVASFADPHPYGYLYAGRTVDPPRHVPLVRSSPERDAVLASWRTVAGRLEALPEVVSATAYRARLIPPLAGVPRHDALLLVRTTSVAAIPTVQAAPAYAQLDLDFAISARNARRIGDTDRTRSGTFLFNHFTADDPDCALAVWETLTGWYLDEIGVDNSTVLQPTGDTRYAFVNYVRLPGGPLRFLLGQLARPTFHSFVRSRLSAHHMRALPVLCEPV